MVFRYGAALSLCVVLLVACSIKLKIGVVNNTGEDVTILLGDDELKIISGHFARFGYPTIAQRRTMQVLMGKCTYTYVFPGAIENYVKVDGFEGVVMVQLEGDHRIYLIPPKSNGTVLIPNVMSLQSGGFPLTPDKEECI